MVQARVAELTGKHGPCEFSLLTGPFHKTAISIRYSVLLAATSDHHKHDHGTTHIRQVTGNTTTPNAHQTQIHRHITCSGHVWHCKRIPLISAPTSTCSLIDHINRAANKSSVRLTTADTNQTGTKYRPTLQTALIPSIQRSLQRQIKQSHPLIITSLWPRLPAGYLESAVECRTAP